MLSSGVLSQWLAPWFLQRVATEIIWWMLLDVASTSRWDWPPNSQCRRLPGLVPSDRNPPIGDTHSIAGNMTAVLDIDGDGACTATLIQTQQSPKRVFRDAKQQTARLLKRLQRARERNDEKTASFLQQTLLKSTSAKLVAADEAGRRLRRSGKCAAEGIELQRLAKCLSATSAPEEKVVVRPKWKDASNFRAIYQFGQANLARQILVRMALKPFAKFDQRQFMSGGGREAACRHILSLMPTHRWVVKADIKTFYLTVDRDWLRQSLPIGKEITSSTVLLENQTNISYQGWGLHSPYASDISLSHAARSGLPQGASSSPIVAEMIGAEIMSQIPLGIEIVNYADDFLVLGRTRAEAEKALQTLCSAVKRCPAGSFVLKVGKVRRSADGIDFLGYNLRSGRYWTDAKPLKKTLDRFVRRIPRIITNMQQHKPADKRCLMRYVSGWRASNQLWTSRDHWIFQQLRPWAMAFPELSREILAPWIKHIPIILSCLGVNDT